jgi:TIR domain-containing protein
LQVSGAEAHNDRDAHDRLKDKHSIRVFMDTAGLDRAGRFPPRLKRAIEECDVFVCFLAGDSLKSKWVNEEVRLAHEFAKVMIPIFQESFLEPAELLDESPVKVLLSHQGIKLFDVSGHYVDHAVTDLARLVKGTMSDEADFL